MNRLLNLLAANRNRGQFRVEQAADEATIYLYDVIVADDYWGGVSHKTFVPALNEIQAPVIHLRVDSPGGDVFAARAIEQAIREHPSQIVAHIDGHAASAASYVVMAADQRRIAPGGFVMIHKAWTIAFGNADELLQVADLLEKIDGTLVDTYAAATGQSPDQIREWLAAETWFTADEAVANGFADEIATGKQSGASARTRWDLSAYEHPPEIPANDPEPAPAAYSQQHHDHLRRRLEVIGKLA